jgi:hypothetical protein
LAPAPTKRLEFELVPLFLDWLAFWGLSFMFAVMNRRVGISLVFTCADFFLVPYVGI